MPTTTTAQNTAEETKQRSFAPIRRDLLDRLTRECDSKVHNPWDQSTAAAQYDVLRKFRLR